MPTASTRSSSRTGSPSTTTCRTAAATGATPPTSSTSRRARRWSGACDAWATWALTGATYELSSVYAYDDGTGSAYFDTEARNLNSIISEADTELYDYLSEHGLSVRDGEEPAPLSEEQRAEVAVLWQDACERAASPEGAFVSVELARVGETWTVDEESLDEALESALGLY